MGRDGAERNTSLQPGAELNTVCRWPTVGFTLQLKSRSHWCPGGRGTGKKGHTVTMRLCGESAGMFQALLGFIARPAKTLSFLQTLYLRRIQENRGQVTQLLLCSAPGTVLGRQQAQMNSRVFVLDALSYME